MSVPLLKSRTRGDLSRRLGAEGEPGVSVVPENTIIGILINRVKVGEPTESSTRESLEVWALGIQKVKVIPLLVHADSTRRGRLGRVGLSRGPTGLSQDDLLAAIVVDEKVQVVPVQTPGILSVSCRLPRLLKPLKVKLFGVRW